MWVISKLLSRNTRSVFTFLGFTIPGDEAEREEEDEDEDEDVLRKWLNMIVKFFL